MESSITRYLFDANAIRRLSYESILNKSGPNTTLETTSDIIIELGDRSAQKRHLITPCTFDRCVYDMMAELLAAHQKVRDLLDYYNNRGVGDVGILAYALVADEGKLLKDNTVIVTDDGGVIGACKDLGLAHIGTGEF